MSINTKNPNFKKPEVRQKSLYKIMVVFKASCAINYPKNPFYYYGYNSKPNFGIDKLEKLAKAKEKEADIITLINNETGVRIRYLYRSKPPIKRKPKYAKFKNKFNNKHKRKRIIPFYDYGKRKK